MGNCIHGHKIIELEYRKTNGEVTKALIKPVGLVCSECYFYLIVYYGDADKKHTGYPTVYRMDRIQSYRETKDNFNIPYKDRFEEGEFRKRIPFMYTGQLQKNGSYRVTVEVYGDKGLEMWVKIQSDYISEPKG